jgi:hypothetical protein
MGLKEDFEMHFQELHQKEYKIALKKGGKLHPFGKI